MSYDLAVTRPTIRQNPERGNSETTEIVSRDDDGDSGSKATRMSWDR